MPDTNTNWTDVHVENWRRWLAPYIGKECRALEIGCFEGRSSQWFLDNILTHPDSSLTVVDTFQVMTNFEIGRRIVEHEQKGAKRAAYGTELLKELSARLTEEFGRGFSRSNLEYMRKFFLYVTMGKVDSLGKKYMVCRFI